MSRSTLRSVTAASGALALLAAAAALVAVTAPPAAANRQRSVTYVLPGDRVFPEGIDFDNRSGSYFVSSTTDGTIFRGSLGEPAATPFLPGGQDGRTTAVGLKVDRAGRLFIAGGATGGIWVYDIESRQLLARFNVGASPTFVNDVVVTRSGAFFTDSQSPFLYRVYEDEAGGLAFERFLDFTVTPLAYQPGFNANGIDATPDGRYLIVVQSNTGKLFRIDTRTRAVTQIGLGGAALTNGDGILLQGRLLYVVRNAQEQIALVRLSGDLTQGRVLGSLTDPTFQFPTTAAFARGSLLVVNSQFDRRGPGLTPDLPFTVTRLF